MRRPGILQMLVAGAAAVLLVSSVVGLAGRDTGASPSGAGGSGGAGGPAAGTVAIANFAFAPATLRVKAGDAVTWTNQDSDAHTVTSSGPGPLHSGELRKGATYHATFAEPGTFAYICAIHPSMEATVVVTG